MTDPPVPLAGSTLILGPSNAGKTTLTARALDAWIDDAGPGGVVLDFAPEIERDGRLLGGRLDRFTSIPDAAWHGAIEAHAPRFEAESDEAALALARENAEHARRLLDAAPDDPCAVFVNDATIPLQADGDPAPLTAYCDAADLAVLNAFESDELGTDDRLSRNERAALSTLRAWADRVRRLG